MNQTETLLKTIINGLQEKKGRNIITVNMTKIQGTICDYMVICEGSSPTQVSSLSDSVWDFVSKDAGEKPLSVDGNHSAVWIGMDYGTILVHIFMPEQRNFYNLEHLWADAKLTSIPDLV